MTQETTTSLTGCEKYDQLLKFVIRARDLGVQTFELNDGELSLKCHVVPPLTTEENQKKEEEDLYGASR